jgi:outer membrane lipoprotein-sorting protein
MQRKDWVRSITVGIILGIVLIALQSFGYLPQAKNAHAASDIEKILTKTLQSHKNWSSLQGEAQLTQYDADNNPEVNTVTVEIEQPLKANVAFKASEDKSKINYKLVSDGLNVYTIDDGNLSFTKSDIPSFAKKPDLLPQALADVKKDEVYHHPFEMLISNPMMQYVYSEWFAQVGPGSTYQLLGEETIAGRLTWKVDLLTATDHAVAWIDEETGIILKYLQESGGQTVVQMEFTSIQINSHIDGKKFSAPDKSKYHQVNSQ